VDQTPPPQPPDKARHDPARAHPLLRLLRTAGAVVTIAAGTALLVLPGPGIVLILAGLGLLAVDYPAAARLRDRLAAHGKATAGRAGRLAGPTGRAVLRTLTVMGAVLTTVLILAGLAVATLVIVVLTRAA